MEFAPGDIVELKSGSPLLTVESVIEGSVSCIWFEETLGEFRTHAFAPVLLAKVEIEEEEDEDEDEEDEDER